WLATTLGVVHARESRLEAAGQQVLHTVGDVDRLVAETLEVAGDEGDIRDLARGDFAAGELADDGEHAKVQGIHLLVDGRDHRNGGGSRLGKQLDEGAADAHGSGAHVGEHVAELVREGVLRVTDANQGADVSGEVAHALD